MRRIFMAALAVLFFPSWGMAQQPPVSIYGGKVRSLGYCQITSLAAAKTLVTANCATGSVPTSGINYIVVTVEAQAVRYRADGTAPTATVGLPLAVGTQVVFALTDFTKLQFIESTAGAILNVDSLQ